MKDLYEQAQDAVIAIRNESALDPKIGIVLGSGLGLFAASLENSVAIPYSKIPYFPQSTVPGHSGKLVIGTIGGVPIAVMQGRVHAYEGYPLSEVTFPMRVFGLLGIKTAIVTNAAGGIRTSLRPGELVLIEDHINLTGSNAALGHNEPRFGPRFFDMSTAYSPRLRTLALDEGGRLGLSLSEGVYLAVLGPSYETPAEIRAFRTLGADLVGMSTVHEVIIARHMGIEVLGISLVTNMAAGVLKETINHEEVMEIGRHAAEDFARLLTAIVPRIAAQPQL
ncbi:MAG TPA: purine-nucleoside phosphorylase [Granulicella sp.]